jgi:hypothetical protein
MKEQLAKSRETASSAPVGGDVVHEPVGLTTRTQKPYRRSGDIFMPEPGAGDIQTTPATPPDASTPLRAPTAPEGVTSRGNSGLGGESPIAEPRKSLAERTKDTLSFRRNRQMRRLEQARKLDYVASHLAAGLARDGSQDAVIRQVARAEGIRTRALRRRVGVLRHEFEENGVYEQLRVQQEDHFARDDTLPSPHAREGSSVRVTHTDEVIRPVEDGVRDASSVVPEVSEARDREEAQDVLPRAESEANRIDARPQRIDGSFTLDSYDLESLAKGMRNLSQPTEALRRLAKSLSSMSPQEKSAQRDYLLKQVEEIDALLHEAERRPPTTEAFDLDRMPDPDIVGPEGVEAWRARVEREAKAYEARREQFVQTHDLSNYYEELAGIRGVKSRIVNHILRGDMVETELSMDDADPLAHITYPDRMSDKQKEMIDYENQLRDKVRPVQVAQQEIDRLLDEGGTREQIDEEYQKIEHLILHDIDLGDHSAEASKLLELIARVSLDRRNKEKEHYGMAVEYALELVIGRGDENPTSEYPANPGFYVSNNIDAMMEATRRYDRDFAIYLTNLRGKRVLAHELFRNLKDRKTYVEYVTRALDTGGLRFIESQVGGIPEVQLLYEKELARKTAIKGYRGEGWLLFEDYFDNPEDQHKESIDRNMKNLITGERLGLTRTLRNGATRRMRPWERNRAYFMGRAMTAGSQRRLIYSIFGDTPPGKGGADFIMSLEAEPITSILSMLKFDANRWKGQYVAKRFRRHLFGIMRHLTEKSGKRYSISGEINGEKAEYGLFGASVDGTVMIDTGTQDPKSVWWRINKIFLDNPRYQQATARGRLTVSDYIDAIRGEIGRGYDANKSDKQKRKETYDHDRSHHIDHQLALDEHGHAHYPEGEEFKSFIEQQRLFLGTLLQRSDVSTQHKEILWRTISRLNPSRIAALMPHFAMDKVKDVYGLQKDKKHDLFKLQDDDAQKHFNTIMNKLFIVEFMRVMDDAQGFRTKTDGTPVTQDYQTHDLRHYIDLYNNEREALKIAIDNERDEGRKQVLEQKLRAIGSRIDEQEIAVIEKWQQLGVDKADQLARIKCNIALFLDDVPETAWNLMGRTDLDRILVGDQSGFQEAYGGLIGLIANPAIKAEEALKPMAAYVHTVMNILDLGQAQGYVEPFLTSYLRMAKKKGKVNWIPFAKTLRKARSEIEEFNLQAEIAYDAEDIGNILEAAAQHEIISDDPNEAKKMSRFLVLDKFTESKAGKALLDNKVMKKTRFNKLFYKNATQFQHMIKHEKADWNKKLRERTRLFLLIFGAILPIEVLKAILPEEVSKNI